MADTALDLSKPTPTKRVAPFPTENAVHLGPDMSSDSGRASTSSTSSNEDAHRAPAQETDPNDSLVDVKPPLSISPPPQEHRDMEDRDDDIDDEDLDEEDNDSKSDRVANIRPFKMYPMDGYPSMVGNPLTPMAGTPSLSPSAAAAAAAAGFSPASFAGMPTMLDPSAVSPFALTPMTSHLLQRKRKADNRAVPIPDKLTIPVPEEKKDDAYWERRRKNNEAAKRSRDARRMKEEEIAMRAAFLEQENLKLRAQVAILKNETAKLHYMLYNRV